MNHRFNPHDEGTHEQPKWQRPAPVRVKRSTRKQQPELVFLLGLFALVGVAFVVVTAPF